ncbi:MAG: OmpA family protein [Alphaproteobacteria bacterium]|nr:OmpA family protein [Alphaproteobacteria bacterium]MBU2292557.1 OmpA family protein [Alphaproteobacteria bacterium]
MTPVALLLAGALLQTPPPSMTIIEPILYFDSGSTTPRPLNRRNFEVIVEYALRPDVSEVIIQAHTDTVGSVDANLALARARGQVIADRLAAEGVPPAIIRIEALGENRPARPTADGVAEPLNRYVWVDISSGVR